MTYRAVVVFAAFLGLGCSAKITVEGRGGPEPTTPTPVTPDEPPDITEPPVPFGAACSEDGIVHDAFAYNVGDQASLDALTGCTEIEGSLYISEATTIVNVDPLLSLERVSGEVRIRMNAALTDLDGLASLVEVGWHLDVLDNPVLERIDGLLGVEVVGGDLWIRSNPLLPTCSADEVAASIDDGALTGDIVIEDNNDLGVCE